MAIQSTLKGYNKIHNMLDQIQLKCELILKDKNTKDSITMSVKNLKNGKKILK